MCIRDSYKYVNHHQNVSGRYNDKGTKLPTSKQLERNYDSHKNPESPNIEKTTHQMPYQVVSTESMWPTMTEKVLKLERLVNSNN